MTNEAIVELPERWLSEHLRRLAQERTAKFQGRAAPYGHSRQSGNEVGLRGEAAVLLWLDGNGFRLNVSEGYGSPDVLAGKPGPPWIRIEVKSWPEVQWNRFGLQVAASQLKRVVSQSWLVIWTAVHTAQTETPNYVTLKGWTSTADLVQAGEPVWTAGVHANVRVSERLVRPMPDLAALDPMTFRIFIPSSQERACTHPVRLGVDDA